MGNFGLGGVLMGRFLPLDCEVHGSVPAATNFLLLLPTCGRDAQKYPGCGPRLLLILV